MKAELTHTPPHSMARDCLTPPSVVLVEELLQPSPFFSWRWGSVQPRHHILWMELTTMNISYFAVPPEFEMYVYGLYPAIMSETVPPGGRPREAGG